MADRWICLTTEQIKHLESLCMDDNTDPELSWNLANKLKKSQKKISISSAKSKGRNLQYSVCEKISQLINIPFNQSSDDSLIRSREMGQHGKDVVLRGEAKLKFPFSIECKSSESFNIPDAYEQAKENADGLPVMIVCKKKALPEPLFFTNWEGIKTLYEYRI